MNGPEEEYDDKLIQPHASDDMYFCEEGFKAFSRLFIPKTKKLNFLDPENTLDDEGYNS